MERGYRNGFDEFDEYGKPIYLRNAPKNKEEIRARLEEHFGPFVEVPMPEPIIKKARMLREECGTRLGGYFYSGMTEEHCIKLMKKSHQRDLERRAARV